MAHLPGWDAGARLSAGTRVLAVSLALLLCGFVGPAAAAGQTCRRAYNHGFNAGINNGFKAGFQTGFSKGYEKGYGNGAQASADGGEGSRSGAGAAVTRSCTARYDQGYRAGYAKGYDRGYKAGFNSGFNAGWKAAHAYVDPVGWVQYLQARRIDLGVDYRGSGPLAALGDGTVVMATNNDSGPASCWANTCWPSPGGVVVYQLASGRFAGKYVYMAENITVNVSAGQRVKAGQQLATLYDAYPNLEIGWASGWSSQTLAVHDGNQCPCGDPGGWSSIEGRNFNALLTSLGAPSGYLQPNPPNQSMPAGWPS